jgi:hypothetical protein
MRYKGAPSLIHLIKKAPSGIDHKARYDRRGRERVMFIFSVRASSIKFFGILILTFALLVGIMLSGETVLEVSQSVGEVKLSGMKTDEDRIEFLKGFGIEVDGECEEKAFIMPESFDRITSEYNEIQKAQGLDLTKYAKKRVTRYTYKVSNWDEIKERYGKTDQSNESSGAVDVRATLFIYRHRIIALDISSAEMGGFVEPIIK